MQEHSCCRKSAHSMIGLEVIDLFLEEVAPQVLADEFDHLQVVRETRPLLGGPAKL